MGEDAVKGWCLGQAAVTSLGVTGTLVLTLARPLTAWPVPAKGTLLLTGVSSEAGSTSASPPDWVTGSSILTPAFHGAVLPEGAIAASFAAVGPRPSSFTAAASLCAKPMLAAVGGAAVQLVAGSALPEVPRALAAPLHTGPMAAAVRRLAAGLVHTHHS